MNSEIAETAARALFAGVRYNSDSYADGHLAKVAMITKALGGDDEAVSVAWLHDVIEDIDPPSVGWDYWFVGGNEFSEHVYDSVVALTKSIHEGYEDYIERIVCSSNHTVRLVKFADSLVNLSSVQPDHTPEQVKRRLSRYIGNLNRLGPLIFP